MIREAIWDVDGTLVDTATEHFHAWQVLVAERHWNFTEADFARTFGWRNPEILRALFDPNMSDQDVAAISLRKETLYRASIAEGRVSLLPGVGRLLAELKAAGIRQVVGSSAPRANVELLLSQAGIEDYFAAIITGDDVTKGKPDPEVFLKGMTTSPQHCVVFEDAVAGVQAAKAAGMVCIAVTSAGHHPAETLYRAGADRVVATFDDLPTADVVAMGARP